MALLIKFNRHMKKSTICLFVLSLLFANIFGTGGKAFGATSYTLTNGVLTITGSGAMTDYNSSTAMPWNSNKASVTSIVINEGVTSVGKYAFYGCSNATSVQIASTVTSIGQYAFQNCSNLATIKLGTSSTYKCNIDTIYGSAFSSCSKVAYVYCYGSSATDGMARWLKIGFNATTSNPFNASTVTTKYFYTNTSRQTSLTASNLSGATAIKQFAFYNNTSLTAVTLPTTITWIGKQAFGKCSNTGFTKITIPENVTVCGDDVFTGCSALNSVTWNATNCTQYEPGKTYTTSYFPFYNTTLSGQITSFTFGDNVTTIPPVICCKMSNLPSIAIPASVTSIGAETFKGCTGLTSIVSLATTPPTVANVNAFTSVTKSIPVVVTSADAVTAYEGATGWIDFTNITTVLSGSCGTNATFELNFATGVLTISGTGAMSDYATSDSNRSPWYKYNSYITDIVVSSGITALGNAAFANCDVETCTISASVTNFVTQCFFGAKVNKLYYGGTLSQWCNITRGANNPHPVTQKFYINSSEITSLTLPSISSLAAKAFINMKGITAVTIPASVTTIGADAFSGCSNIINVYYQGTLAQWCAISFSNDQEANPAFNGASLHITDSDIDDGVVYVKDAITSIGNYAFCGVTNYTSIDINAATTVGAYTFKNCTAQILYRGSATGTSGNVTWNWEDGVLTLSGSGTMNNYTSAANVPWTPYMASTHEIVVEDGITSIGNYAFNSPAASPITVTLPSSGLTTIGNSSFSGLKALRELTIPNGVTTIGTNAFSSCTNLEKIYCPSTVPALTNAAGGGVTVYNSFASNAPFYVLPASYSSYSGSAWTSFGSNFFIYGDCGADNDNKNVQWVLSSKTGVMSFSGSGNVRGYGNGSTPWYSLRTLITSATFSEGITATGGWCFQDCSNLASVSLPSTLTTVSVRTFNATIITDIEIPEGVTNIDNYAFYNCTSLTSIDLPSTLTHIGMGVFEGCSTLASIELPEGLTNIGYKAFVGCSSLASITIPRTVTTMQTSSGSYTFQDCSNLHTVNWNAEACADFNKYNSGSGFTYYTPFGNTKANITSFNFGEHVRIIPSCLCQGMTGITSVTLPASVEQIHQDAFNGCTGLTSITIPAKVTTMQGTVFENCSNLASVTSQATTPPTIQSTTFSGASLKKLYVPHSVSVKAAYRVANYWSSFTEANTFPKIVQFDLQSHGDDIDPQYFDNLTSKALAPDEPSVTGYTFGGWYQEDGCVNAFNFGSTNITADKTLYAKWTINTYDVTFNLQGHGDPIAPQSIEYNGWVSEPSAPSEDYYTFGGWYKEAGCSNAWDFSTDRITAATTLYAKWTMGDLALNENADNSGALDAYNDHTTDVTMTRSLTNAQYNTFCLPFSLSASQMTTAFGADYDLEELTNVAFDAGTKELTLMFTKKSALEAGKPYLLKPANDVINPSFTGVTISNATPSDGLDNGYIEFHGVYSPTSLTGGNKNLLFLGVDNTLYFPQETGDLKGFRAYFEVKGAAAGVAVRARIVRHEDAVTSVESNQQSAISSQKVIRDGQLLILREGKMYNAQGMLVK